MLTLTRCLLCFDTTLTVALTAGVVAATTSQRRRSNGGALATAERHSTAAC
jgi:hypothetical protein